MDDESKGERPADLAPVVTQLNTSLPRSSRFAEETMARKTRHWGQMATQVEDGEAETGVEDRGIQTLTRDSSMERVGRDAGETDRRERTPPLPTIVTDGEGSWVSSAKSGQRSRGAAHLIGPSLELKKAWKTEAIERLAKMGKTPAVLERCNSDTFSVLSLEDLKLKRRIHAARPPIAVMMIQDKAIRELPSTHERRASIPAGSQEPSKRRRARSLTPNTNTIDLMSQRRSSNSSDPLSLKTDRQRSSDPSSNLERSMSKSKRPSGAEFPLNEEATDEGNPPAGIYIGTAMYERRRSMATSLLDTNGNLSYASRKSLRRGSYTDTNVMERPSRLPKVSESYTIEDRRQLLTQGRQRGSKDAILSGLNLLETRDELGAMANRPPQGSTMNRRRRSRAPASLAEDISRLTAKQGRRISGLKRFRRAVKVVLLCVSMCQRSYLRGEKEKEAFLSLDSTSGLLGGQRLLFDPAYFKADRQQRASEETKRILNLTPEERTDDLIKYVEIALRNIRAFAQYPLRMQHKLCKVGWLEEYESKRVILRQGHSPHAFYFILSGEVIVTVLDTKKGKRVAETVATLQRGESFGELAILNRTQRASTVISQDRVELLCISVEDFEDIFMLSGGIKRSTIPISTRF